MIILHQLFLFSLKDFKSKEDKILWLFFFFKKIEPSIGVRMRITANPCPLHELKASMKTLSIPIPNFQYFSSLIPNLDMLANGKKKKKLIEAKAFFGIEMLSLKDYSCCRKKNTIIK